MDNRDKLKKFINGGDLKARKQKIYAVCKGEKTLLKEEEIEGSIDLNIEVHCNDLSQLEMQKNTNLQKSKNLTFSVRN